jgi:hypothetical protein
VQNSGINRILYNNHRIATDDKTGTSDLSLSSVMTASDKPSAASSKIKADMSRNNIQRDGPKSIPPEKMDEGQSSNSTLAYWQLSEYDLIVPFGVMSFQHSLLYEGKRWWRSVNREGGPSSITEKKPSAKAS